MPKLFHDADVKTIRDELFDAVLDSYDGSDIVCRIEKIERGAFCLQFNGGPIFTVRASHGGMLTSEATTIS